MVTYAGGYRTIKMFYDNITLTNCLFHSLPHQHVTSSPSGWRPFLAPRTARRPMRSSPSAMLWGCLTSRQGGSIRCQTTGTRTMSACTLTSPPSVEPSWTWCISSSGEQSPWSMTTAQVQVQSMSVFILQWGVLGWSSRGGEYDNDDDDYDDAGDDASNLQPLRPWSVQREEEAPGQL